MFVSPCLSVCVLQAVMASFGTQGPRATDMVTRVAVSISCENLLDMDAFSKSDPLCVLLMNSSGPHWCEVRRSTGRSSPNSYRDIKSNFSLAVLRCRCMLFSPQLTSTGSLTFHSLKRRYGFSIQIIQDQVQ